MTENEKSKKKKFVENIISDLLIEANTGWYDARYEVEDSGEYVYLISLEGYRSNAINVTGDSLRAIVSDVFKSM